MRRVLIIIYGSSVCVTDDNGKTEIVTKGPEISRHWVWEKVSG